MCIGDCNRPFEEPALLDPGRTGQFAVSIEGKPACEDRVMIPWAARVDDRDAGPNGRALNKGRVADFDARDVGDHVQRAGRSREADTQVASARSAHGLLLSWLMCDRDVLLQIV